MTRLHHVQVGCPVGGEEAARTPFVPATRAHPGLLVDDIEAAAEQIVRFGFPLTWDGEFPGYTRFYTEDGNGNRVEVLASL